MCNPIGLTDKKKTEQQLTINQTMLKVLEVLDIQIEFMSILRSDINDIAQKLADQQDKKE